MSASTTTIDINVDIEDDSVEGASPASAASAVTQQQQQQQKKAAPEVFTFKAWDNEARREQPDVKCKVVVVGASGVGKTSLLYRFVKRHFSTAHPQTVAVDFNSIGLIVDEKRVECSMWDTAGEERFAQLASSYFSGAHVVVFVIALNDPRSLEKLEATRELVKTRAPGCVCILLGNKSDLLAADQNPNKMGSLNLRRHAREMACSAGYMAVSAKNGTGIDTAIVKCVALAIRRTAQKRSKQIEDAAAAAASSAGGNIVDLNARSSPLKRAGCCGGSGNS